MKFFLVLSSVVAVLSDLLFVWWAKHEAHPVLHLILAFVLLNVAGLIWAYSMKAGIESPMAITFYALATTLGCSYLGIYIFNESLSTTNYVGMGLGLISLVLVSW